MRFAGWAAIVMLALVAADAWAFQQLADARDRWARAVAAARPVSLAIPRDRSIRAGDADEARRMLAALLARRGAAAGVGLTVQTGPATDPPGFVSCDLAGDGEEAALRALARAIEEDRAGVRLIGWRIARTGGQLRLQARAVAPWRRS